MKASSGVTVAAASASTSLLVAASPKSSVSYLVAAYEELASISPSAASISPTCASGAVESGPAGGAFPQQTTAAESNLSPEPSSSSTVTALATLPTATGLTPAGAQPTSNILDTDTALAQQPLSSDTSSVVIDGVNATPPAFLAEPATTGTQQVSPVAITTSTSLSIELNSFATGYSQESLLSIPLYTSATTTCTTLAPLYTSATTPCNTLALQAPSYPGMQTTATEISYETSLDVDGLPTASLQSYITAVTYNIESSTLLSTTTSDCDDGAAVIFPSSTLLLAPATLATLESLPTPVLPATTHTPSIVPLGTPTLITGALTTLSTVTTDCDESIVVHTPTDSSTSRPPLTSIFTPTDSFTPQPPLTSIITPPALVIPDSATAPVPTEPLSETPCSTLSTDVSLALPPQIAQETSSTPSLPAGPPPSSISSASLPSSAPHTLPTSMSSLLAPETTTSPMTTSCTTLSTIPRPTITSTTTKQTNLVPSSTTTHNGGFTQGSGTADPQLFAGNAPSSRTPSRAWWAVGLYMVAGWLLW